MPEIYPASREGARRLARDIVSRLVEQLEGNNDAFLLRELSKPLVSEMLPAGLGVRLIDRPRSTEGPEPFRNALEWFIRYYFRQEPDFKRVGQGVYQRKTVDELDAAIADEEDGLEAEDEELNAGQGEASAGFIYAFTLPVYLNEPGRPAGRVRVKVGKTMRTVEGRIAEQTKSGPEFPKILAAWNVPNHGHVESCLKHLYHARGHKVADAPGTEWFWTNVEEVEVLLNFITENNVTRLPSQMAPLTT